jgi:hypothetical protein
MKLVTGLGQFPISGKVVGALRVQAVPCRGPGFPARIKERQRIAYEASQSAARLNAVLKKRREAWDKRDKESA